MAQDGQGPQKRPRRTYAGDGKEKIGYNNPKKTRPAGLTDLRALILTVVKLLLLEPSSNEPETDEAASEKKHGGRFWNLGRPEGAFEVIDDKTAII